MKQKQKTRGILVLRVKKYLKYQSCLALLFAVLFIFAKSASASSCDRVVISEVQITGGPGKTDNDFVELLNMGDQACNLKGYRLVKRTKSGAADTPIKAWDADALISPWGYYLWANSANGFATQINADASTSQSLANDNGIALRHGENDTGAIVDALAWGTSQSIFSAAYLFQQNPEANQSIERDIEADGKTFFLQSSPNPRNSSNIYKSDDSDDEEIEEPPVVDEKYLCKDMRLNEVYPFGDEEYVEIINNENHACDLSGWWIEDDAKHKKYFPSDTLVEAEDFATLKGNLYLNNDEDKVYLFDKNGEKVQEIAYEADADDQDKSFSFFGSDWRWTKILTPEKENEQDTEDEEEEENEEIFEEEIFDSQKDYAGAVMINEILPYPEKGEEEFIELYNSGDTDEDLFGWTLRDASKSGKYEFKEHVVIKAKEFLVLFESVFGFALNNSGKESVVLRDDEGEVISGVSYQGSKKNASYNFNGSKWKWSRFLTPGKENIFNNEPYGKIRIPKDVYENVYADFSVGTGDADGDEVKVTWDFGDKHKSYLAKTRHKYEKEGEYDGSVKLSDASEDVIHQFKIKVKEFPHPKVRIVAVNANPEGSDTKNETIIIENKSKKKINLNGWSIATGSSSKKLINHPIREDLEINKKKVKEITREISSFTLNNKKGKIELRYPDGEVAHKVKYKKEEGIEEGEVYEKVEGGWEWVQSQKSIKFIKSIKSESENEESEEIKNLSSVIGMQGERDLPLVTESLVTENAETDSSPVTEIPVENKFIELNNELVEIEMLKVEPKVLGVESVREIDGKYLLIPPSPEQEHYAVVFLKEITTGANEEINSLLNYFLN